MLVWCGWCREWFDGVGQGGQHAQKLLQIAQALLCTPTNFLADGTTGSNTTTNRPLSAPEVACVHNRQACIAHCWQVQTPNTKRHYVLKTHQTMRHHANHNTPTHTKQPYLSAPPGSTPRLRLPASARAAAQAPSLATCPSHP